jgi:hypothetical protein
MFFCDEDEIIEVVRIIRTEARKMVMDERICDAKTIMLLMRSMICVPLWRR